MDYEAIREKQLSELPFAELPHQLTVEGECVLHGSQAHYTHGWEFRRVAIPLSEIRILSPMVMETRRIKGERDNNPWGGGPEERFYRTLVTLSGDVKLVLAHRFEALEEHLRSYRSVK